MVKNFAEKEIRLIARQGDSEDKFPLEVIDEMRELGVFGLKIPHEYGGSGISSTAYANVFEELSYVWMTSPELLETNHSWRFSSGNGDYFFHLCGDGRY